MVAALLAALFAMGVFSATGVGAQTVTPEDGNLTNLSVTGLTQDDADGGSFEATVYNYKVQIGNDDVNLNVDPTTPTGTSARVKWNDQDMDGTTAAVVVPLANDGAHVERIDIVVSDSDNADTTAYSTKTYTIQLNYDSPTSKTTPGAAVTITVTGTMTVTAGGTLSVDLPKFVLPPSIDNDDVVAGGNNPGDVSIDGTKLIISLGNNPTSGAPNTLSGNQTLLIRSSAGVANPLYANEKRDSYKITVSTEAADDLVRLAIVTRQVSVSPAKANRGEEITITGKGFTDGSAVLSAGGVEIGEPNVADGTFELAISNDLKDGDDNVFSTEGTRINVVDSNGSSAARSATHTITPTFSVAPAEASPGQEMTVTLKDITGLVSMVHIAGKLAADAAADDDNDNGDQNKNPEFTDEQKAVGDKTAAEDTTFKFQVPSDTRIGTLRMTITFAAATPAIGPLSTSITIGAQDLEISPESAVPGQQINISGSGFSTKETISDDGEDSYVRVDDQNALGIGQTEAATTNGDVRFTATVPLNVGSGTHDVEVKGANGRVGVGTITVPAPAVTLNPDTGIRGSTVTVTGSGFTADDFVQVQYEDTRTTPSRYLPVGSGSTTDGDGNFTATFNVPSYAALGKTSDVRFVTQVNTDDKDPVYKTKHSTPKPEISVTPASSQAGGTIMVSVENFAGFARVESLTIGGIPALPSPAPLTDANGAITDAPGHRASARPRRLSGHRCHRI